MATKKAAKKVPAKKPTGPKKRPASFAPTGDALELASYSQKHELHLHNVSKSAANWQLSGGGNKVRGVTPPEGHSIVRVEHAGRGYKITFWCKPDKKTSCTVGPDGCAIYTGSKIHITHGH